MQARRRSVHRSARPTQEPMAAAENPLEDDRQVDCPPTMKLQRELRFFNENKAEWLKGHAGKYALVKGDALVAFFPTKWAAYDKALRKFGKQPFLIKRITERDEVAQLPSFSVVGNSSDRL